MIRALASRIPAQKAVMSPTGPAPITVTSRISVSSGAVPLLVMAALRVGGRHGLAVEGVEGALHRGRDAGEDRRLAQRVRARLGASQLLHQIEELAGIVGVERNHEFLIVYPERVRGVDLDRPVPAPDLDVCAHDPAPLLRGQQIPLALL